MSFKSYAIIVEFAMFLKFQPIRKYKDKSFTNSEKVDTIHWIFTLALVDIHCILPQIISSPMLSLLFPTPSLSALVRCTPAASPVNKFDEIASPVPNYVSLVNKWISFYPAHKETLSPTTFGKIGSPHWNRIFSAGS